MEEMLLNLCAKLDNENLNNKKSIGEYVQNISKEDIIKIVNSSMIMLGLADNKEMRITMCKYYIDLLTN